MNLKWMGSIMIIVACGGAGWAVAGEYRRQEQSLRQLLRILGMLECELSCRVSTLPDLCLAIGQSVDGLLGRVFLELAKEMQQQISPDAAYCMHSVLAEFPQLPKATVNVLNRLGNSLGRYDLEGQLKELDAVKRECERVLQIHCEGIEARVRTCRTLGLCAGAALAILLV